MALLEDVILRGASGSRPAAATVAVGTIYYSTDTFVTERNNGSSWDDMSDAGSGAPSNADYLVKTANGSLSAERVVTDTASITWDWGTSGQAKANAVALVDAIEMVIDGGGSAITTGVKLDLEIPFACTINRVTTLADQSGSIVVDIWKDSYANYPPTNADSICASAKPTLSSATKAQDSTLTGWTTSISAGDTLRINVDSITTCTRVVVSLKVTRA